MASGPQPGIPTRPYSLRSRVCVQLTNACSGSCRRHLRRTSILWDSQPPSRQRPSGSLPRIICTRIHPPGKHKQVKAKKPKDTTVSPTSRTEVPNKNVAGLDELFTKREISVDCRNPQQFSLPDTPKRLEDTVVYQTYCIDLSVTCATSTIEFFFYCVETRETAYSRSRLHLECVLFRFEWP